ncbi:MAG: 8-oxoguanine DNA glycosylase [Clostridia bacterium]|nr:8-oxoguanine DNA glycosylase [Clostridia bacterium]
MGKLVLEGLKDFSPEQTFECGQCFRWNREADGSYTGVVGKCIANIKALQLSDKARRSSDEAGEYAASIEITTSGEEPDLAFWENYLDLGRNYGAVKERLTVSDPVIAEAVSCGAGIRILRQDAWETLISFIISQNSNIPRIKRCIESLCASFGEKAGNYKGKEYFSFPTPEALASLTQEDISPVRLGYRAPYITATAEKVSSDGIERLDSMKNLSYEDALDYLTGFPGVGPKVASCVLLFGGGHFESFPVDVWVRRVMNRLYGFCESDIGGMRHFAAEHFKDLGGIAQQYLFYYIRETEK